MDKMNITFAKYVNGLEGTTTSISAVIDGVTISVPLDSANRHYAEIMRQVEAGELTIQTAEGNTPEPADQPE
jgi:hypothetical protein